MLSERSPGHVAAEENVIGEGHEPAELVGIVTIQENSSAINESIIIGE